MPPNPPILLASTSRHRRALLERLGLIFACEAPGTDEHPIAGEAPRERALRLACAKATDVARRNPDAVVIGSDQVASLATATGPTLLRKPGTRDICRQQLALMSGNPVTFDTAVALTHGGRLLTHVDRTLVLFRQLTAAEIESYMDREPSFDCAGGFKCEGLGVTLFDSIETRDPTALVGLPLIWLCGALRQWGVPL